MLSALFGMVGIWFFSRLIRVNILPGEYMMLIAFALIISIALVYFLSRNSRKKLRFTISGILVLLLSCGMIYAGGLMDKAVDSVQDMIVETTTVSQVKMAVYVRKDDEAQGLEALGEDYFGIERIAGRAESDRTLEEISRELGLTLQVKEYDSFVQVLRALLEGEIRAAVMEPDLLKAAAIMLGGETDPAELVRELNEFHVAKAPETSDNESSERPSHYSVVASGDYTYWVGDSNETTEEEDHSGESSETEQTESAGHQETQPPATKEPERASWAAAIESPDASRIFTVYIQGIDSRRGLVSRSLSDVNILAVVNMNSRQILLVTTPRDYYVYFAATGQRDKLTHNGWYGVESVMETMRMLYGVRCNYFFRMDFNGFARIIDAMGGVDVYVDREFSSTEKKKTTVEKQVPGTNAAGEEDPEAESVIIAETITEPLYSFTKGTHHMNGSQALVFARERKAFGGGDAIRGFHQMEIIKAVLYKAMSTNLSGLIGSLGGAMETSAPYGIISSLASALIGGGWNISSYSVGGRGSTDYSPALGGNAWIMWPDNNTVSYAQSLIRRVYNGEWVYP